MTIPYTYLLKSKSTGKFYYGLRYANGTTPKDFWKTYFTSSKYVHALIEKYGKDDFEYEIRKTFLNADAAIKWERRVIRKLDLINRDDFLNRGSWPSIGNYERTDVHRAHLSELAKKSNWGKSTQWKVGHTTGWSDKAKEKASETRKKKFENGELDFNGENNPFYGKHHSEETLEKIRIKQKVWLENNQGYRLGGKNPNAKKVSAEGIMFNCVKAVTEHFDITFYEFKKRCKNREDYYYV